MSALEPQPLQSFDPQSITVERLWDANPLMLASDMSVAAAVAKMGKAIAPHLHSESSTSSQRSQLSSCILVMEEQPDGLGRLQGIVTYGDVVRLVAQGIDLQTLTLANVMIHPVITEQYVTMSTLSAMVTLFQQHGISHLPIMDEAGSVLGLVNRKTLLQNLAVRPQDSPKQSEDVTQIHQKLQNIQNTLKTEESERQYLEAALDHAYQLLEERVGLQAAQLVKMNDALLLESQEHQQSQHELERFFLVTPNLMFCIAGFDGYFKRLNPNFSQILGYSTKELMARPFMDFIHPQDQLATQREVERLGQGETTISFENRYLHQDGTYRWLRWNATAVLDEHVIYAAALDVTQQHQAELSLQQQYQQSQLLGSVTRKIRESLELEEILQTAVTEVQRILGCDRVMIVESAPHQTGQVVKESPLAEHHSSLLNYQLTTLSSQLFPSDSTSSHASPLHERTQNERTLPSLERQSWKNELKEDDDPSANTCVLYGPETCEPIHLRACVEVAIYVHGQPWGLLIATQNDDVRQWLPFEIELMQKLADQVGVAIAQAQLLDNLEALVKQRTAELTHTNEQLQTEIQERIATSNALRESQQKLAGILDNADDAIISINSQQQIVLYNQGAEQIFGYTLDEVRHHPLDILLPEVFHQSHRQHVQAFSTSAIPSRQMAERNRTVLGRRKNGEEFSAEASISKLETKTGLLFTVMLKDITERCQAEAALRRSEEQLRLTTDSLPVLISYVDRYQRYRFMNQTYEKWFRQSVDTLCNRSIQAVMGDEFYQQGRSPIEQALGGRKVTYETTMTTLDGRVRDLAVNYIPDQDEDGEVRGFFGLIHDISDRKATERLKDEFVSVVGHELRTPLTSIHGSLKLLSTNRLGSLLPQGQEIVKIALKNTERLTRLINDVLDLERIESGRITMAMQNCTVSELMVQAVQSMQAMADEHGVALQVKPLETSLWGDPDHLAQVLTNLLSNAIKFSPPEATVQIRAVDQDTAIQIQIQDQGRGIPTDKLETIFERFQQVDASDSRERGGTGLGLAICKKIVDQHQGQIWAESTVGEGSTFFVTLPKQT